MNSVKAERWRHVDVGLSTLLTVQALTLFVAIPLGTIFTSSRLPLDLCRLAFAFVSIAVLAHNRAMQATLLAAVGAFAAVPIFTGSGFMLNFGFGRDVSHDIVALTAFVFNGAVTILVARYVFGPGRVTKQRVQGAILIYLNIAALFAIAYGEVAAILPDSITPASGGLLPTGRGVRAAALTYFSISTITTTGFGDLIPVHPIARSMANLESVFGQLFPATLLARLVALQLAHDSAPVPTGSQVLQLQIDRQSI